MKKFLLAAALTAGLCATAQAQDIRFATEASYPPFEFVGTDNTIQGFDIDLANALCKEIEANCTFTNQAFDGLIPGLKFRRFDAVIAGMDITEERLKQVDFTKPYYENSAVFIANKGQIADVSALKGKAVGIQNGTTHQKFLLEQHPEVNTVAYASYQMAILDLKSGRLSAVFGDTAVVNEWLKNEPTLESVGEKVTNPEYFGTGLAIAVRKNNSELQDKFNQALDKVQADGTYQKIYDKWFAK